MTSEEMLKKMRFEDGSLRSMRSGMVLRDEFRQELWPELCNLVEAVLAYSSEVLNIDGVVDDRLEDLKERVEKL